MTMPNQPGDIEEVPEAIVDAESKGFPVVWLLPLVALLVGGWLFYKTESEKGPEITVTFHTAEGIEEGKTQVKFRDVTVGTVNRVDFTEDLKAVQLSITMLAGTGEYLTDKSRFWVVKPRVGAGGITGLGTLLSGAYIAFEPNKAGKPQKAFTGLEKPPIVTIDKEGTRFRLRAESLGSISIGAPVYFRQFDIGEITDYKLADDYSYVDIGVFVQAPYDKYVHTGTYFWNVGGVSISMDASGAKFEMESLMSLLSGGVAFETLPEFLDTPVASENTVFTLYENRSKALERPITQTATFVLRFDGTVRGLSVGAPVEYRGIRVGTVKSIDLGADPKHKGIVGPVVVIDLEPQRTEAYRDIDQADNGKQEKSRFEKDPVARIEELVKRGLRARLQTGSLLTGQLFVEIGLFPDAPPAVMLTDGRYPEIPTLPNTLEGIVASINKILDRLEKADLQGTLSNLNKLMVSTSALASSLEEDVPELADELQKTLQTANRAMATLEASASSDGKIGSQLQDTLKEFSAAARSLRVMAEYLERHPEALIKGKGAP
ncbi:MAG TPA: MCE family protein [Gammaproteobacteria bacterium]|nr:MCE family protein [Gammaproteobacteria bacterium]